MSNLRKPAPSKPLENTYTLRAAIVKETALYLWYLVAQSAFATSLLNSFQRIQHSFAKSGLAAYLSFEEFRTGSRSLHSINSKQEIHEGDQKLGTVNFFKKSRRRRKCAQLIGSLALKSQILLSSQGIDAATVGDQILAERSVRILLRNPDFTEEDFTTILSLAFNGPRAWKPVAISWLVRNARNNATIAAMVHDGLVSESRASMITGRTATLLRLVGPSAGGLPQELAESLLGKLMFLIGVPLDPYSDNSITLLARGALVDLLAQRPELDDAALALIQDARDDRIRQLRTEVLAIGCRARAASGHELLVKLTDVAKLTGEKLDAVATVLDSVITREYDSEPLTLGVRRLKTFSGWLGRRLIAPMLTVTVIFAGAIWVFRNNWSPPTTKPALAEGVAALAAVVTANVFIVQLSTNRLPGFMARAAGHPWQLTVAYVSSILTITIPLLNFKEKEAIAAAGWASVASIGIFGLSLIATVLRWSGRADAIEASRLVEVLFRSRFARTGKRFGRLQVKARQINEFIASVPVVTSTVESVVGENAEFILHPHRGNFLLSKRRLGKLLRNDVFAHGMRLRIASDIGAVKEGGERVMSLVPGRDQSVTPSATRAAKATIKPQSPSDVEFVSSVFVAMLGLAISLAEKSDNGAAQRVNRDATSLMQMHIYSVRRSRAIHLRRQRLRAKAMAVSSGIDDTNNKRVDGLRVNDSEYFTVIPALKDGIEFILLTRMSTEAPLAEIVETFVDSLLHSSSISEATGSMILSRLRRPDGGPVSRKTVELAWRVGLHALERGDTVLWTQCLLWLDNVREDSSSDHSVSVTAHLVAASCRFGSRFSHSGFDHFAAATKSSPKSGTAVYGLWRIGAAAVAAGAMSTMVKSARLAKEREISIVLSQLATRDRLNEEKFVSDLRGGYLSGMGSDALVAFSKIPTHLSDFL